MISAFTDKSVESKITRKLRSIIASISGGLLLRAVEECNLTKDVCVKRQERYVGKTVINKITLLRNVLSMRSRNPENLASPVAVLEPRSVLLATMRLKLDDSMKVVVLIATLEDINEYESVIRT